MIILHSSIVADDADFTEIPTHSIWKTIKSMAYKTFKCIRSAVYTLIPPRNRLQTLIIMLIIMCCLVWNGIGIMASIFYMACILCMLYFIKTQSKYLRLRTYLKNILGLTNYKLVDILLSTITLFLLIYIVIWAHIIIAFIVQIAFWMSMLYIAAYIIFHCVSEKSLNEIDEEI